MWTSILGGLIFILVFAGSILLHELGHFAMARALNIGVDEFGIGFPPRILKLFSWKGTEFTLNWIPLGGFNRIKGEDDPTVPGGMAAANPWKRILVLLAGATMNLLTGVIAFTLLYSQTGLPQPKRVEIASVSVASPAQLAGFQTGDELLTFNGIKVQSIEQVRSYARAHLDQALTFGVLRDGKDLTLTVTPLSSRSAQQGAMGVVLSNPVLPASSWFATLPLSFQSTGQFIGDLLSLPGQIISGAIPAQDAQIGGPRTIWNMFQQSVARDIQSRETAGSSTSAPAQPTNYTLFVIINLTISLGVINLLPIPALDGGRIFMTLPEILLRRRIPARYQTMINGIGFIVLLTLLGFFYIKDIISPVNITLP
jgi:regulator of sigma E protease